MLISFIVHTWNFSNCCEGWCADSILSQSITLGVNGGLVRDDMIEAQLYSTPTSSSIADVDAVTHSIVV